MKKIIKTSIFFLFLAVLLSSFIEIRPFKKTPGTIQFVSNQTFTINDWKFTKVKIDKNDIENLHVEVEMRMGSITCDWKALQKNVKKKKDYFYVKGFPKANVTIDKAQKQADGSYTCQAKLTLKGITKDVPLTFTVSDEGKLHIVGSGIVQRREFDFTGDGPKDEVPMTFDLML